MKIEQQLCENSHNFVGLLVIKKNILKEIKVNSLIKKILTENSVIKLDLYLPLCIAAGQKSSEGNWDVLSFQSSKISLISALA